MIYRKREHAFSLLLVVTDCREKSAKSHNYPTKRGNYRSEKAIILEVSLIIW